MNGAVQPAEFCDSNSSGFDDDFRGKIPRSYVRLTKQRLPLLYSKFASYCHLRTCCIGACDSGRHDLDQPADLTILDHCRQLRMNPPRRNFRDQFAHPDGCRRKRDGKRRLRCEKSRKTRISGYLKLVHAAREVRKQHIVSRYTRDEPHSTARIHPPLKQLGNRSWTEEVGRITKTKIRNFNLPIKLKGERGAVCALQRQRLLLGSSECSRERQSGRTLRAPMGSGKVHVGFSAVRMNLKRGFDVFQFQHPNTIQPRFIDNQERAAREGGLSDPEKPAHHLQRFVIACRYRILAIEHVPMTETITTKGECRLFDEQSFSHHLSAKQGNESQDEVEFFCGEQDRVWIAVVDGALGCF